MVELILGTTPKLKFGERYVKLTISECYQLIRSPDPDSVAAQIIANTHESCILDWGSRG